jgi:hypothetical protein
MPLTGALPVLLALVAGAGDDRLLLCRPRIAGDPALSRPEAVVDAGRSLGSRFLDYGVACDDEGEGARAARRAGLGYAVTSSADGRADGSRYVLVLTEAATEKAKARRELLIGPGQEAVRPLRTALTGLADSLPRGPGPEPAHVAAWSAVGVGVAALATGVALAISAGSAADRADAAQDPASYTHAKAEWQSKRKWSAVSLGAGTALVSAGLAWRFAF